MTACRINKLSLVAALGGMFALAFATHAFTIGSADSETRKQGNTATPQVSLSPRLPVSPSPQLPAPSSLLPATVRPCECLTPAAPYPIWGVDSLSGHGCGEVGWDSRGMIPWQEFAQGEWIGHARTAQVPVYRLREQDQIAVFYRRTREEISRPYELQVGDHIQVESLTAGGGPNVASKSGNEQTKVEDSISRELVVQPDGTITLPLLGQVRATRRTVQSLRDELEESYKKYYRVPSITVTPIKVNTKLEDLIDTVDNRAGARGGFQLVTVVTPAGTIQLPAINSVNVQGLTLDEARREIDARYNATIPGVQVTIDLDQRAPRFIYVGGEVANPGRFELTGPTSAVQAIMLAGGWRVGSNLRQVVVFRRGEDWRLMATMLDLRGALYGRRPVPADDIWLNDSDILLVTKTPIQQADEVIEQVFTRGLYSVVPQEVIWNLNTTGSSAIR
jgi:polysaccharide export outer membrane protein